MNGVNYRISSSCSQKAHNRCSGKECGCNCHVEYFRLTRNQILQIVLFAKHKKVDGVPLRNEHVICGYLKEINVSIKDPYSDDHKFCKQCNCWYHLNLRDCPCCGRKLRVTKRGKKDIE